MRNPGLACGERGRVAQSRSDIFIINACAPKPDSGRLRTQESCWPSAAAISAISGLTVRPGWQTAYPIVLTFRSSRNDGSNEVSAQRQDHLS